LGAALQARVLEPDATIEWARLTGLRILPVITSTASALAVNVILHRKKVQEHSQANSVPAEPRSRSGLASTIRPAKSLRTHRRDVPCLSNRARLNTKGCADFCSIYSKFAATVCVSADALKNLHGLDRFIPNTPWTNQSLRLSTTRKLMENRAEIAILLASAVGIGLAMCFWR
jgi:hypothetical protein